MQAFEQYASLAMVPDCLYKSDEKGFITLVLISHLRTLLLDVAGAERREVPVLAESVLLLFDSAVIDGGGEFRVPFMMVEELMMALSEASRCSFSFSFSEEHTRVSLCL